MASPVPLSAPEEQLNEWSTKWDKWREENSHLPNLQTSEQIEKKSGTAYTTASDSMIPNKKVPIRNWFQMDKKLANKTISKFQKLINKSFKK